MVETEGRIWQPHIARRGSAAKGMMGVRPQENVMSMP